MFLTFMILIINLINAKSAFAIILISYQSLIPLYIFIFSTNVTFTINYQIISSLSSIFKLY